MRRPRSRAGRPQQSNGRTTTVDVGSGDVTAYVKDSWKLIGNTISVPNEFWELPDGTSRCTIAALIKGERDGEYGYAIVFEDADNFHYRMSAQQVKHLATKQMKVSAKGKTPKPIE